MIKKILKRMMQHFIGITTSGSPVRSAPPRLSVFLTITGFACAFSHTASAAASVTYYYTSPQGTVLAKADAAGNVVSNADYRPYGSQALGSPEVGPGYSGHVNDPDSELIYMQARYYDPTAGRFLSRDPVMLKAGDSDGFNRYSYANDNPISFLDPDGRAAQLVWTAPNRVTVTIPYIIGVSNTSLAITPLQINAAVSQRLSGSVDIAGTNVTVTAKAFEADSTHQAGQTNFINVIPTTAGVTTTGTAVTNGIGGNRVTIGTNGPNQASLNNIPHEFGHLAGAADQYATGIDVNGNELKQDAPGASGVMYNMQGPANDQTLHEILSSPTNTNSCAKGVSAPNGGC